MTIIVKDTGFDADDFDGVCLPLLALSPAVSDDQHIGLDLPDPTAALTKWDKLSRVLDRLTLIRVALRDFGDTDVLTLALRLRAAGYRGRLRAHGAVLAQQYTLLRRAGFCEVELTPVQALRQPPEHWRNLSDWSPRGRVVEKSCPSGTQV